MLLNDVHKEQERLAYLLGLSVERHVLGRGNRRAVGVAALGASLLLLLWLISGFGWN
jgi:hypothetical protein